MSSDLSAQVVNSTTQWQEVGAWQSGTVGAVALNTSLNKSGGVVRGLLASRAGVYQWQQPNAAFEPLTRGLSDLHVVAVAFAGGNSQAPATPLAATATGRLFRHIETSDEGWQEIATWAGLGLAIVLAPSPAFSEDKTLFIGTPMGIFRTQDDGQSWESCNFGLLDEDILCLVCAPNYANTEVLFAGTAGGGLYRSRNSGRAWRDSGNGLPDAAVQSLALSPEFGNDATMFVGMEGEGLFVSHDGGEYWSHLALGGYSINALACANTDLLWAGTEDGLWRVDAKSGESLQVTGAGEVAMSVAVLSSGQVAAGFFGSGICYTEDGRGDVESIGWERPTVALHAPPIVARVGAMLVALDADGLLARSSDEGATWAEMESPHPDGVFAVAGMENVRGQVSLFAPTSAGLSRWTDEAEGWQEVGNALPGDNSFTGIELSPSFEQDHSMLAIDLENALHLSQDGGMNWREVSGDWQGQSLLRVHFAPNSSQELAALTMQATAGGHFNLTLWQSHDLGQNWEVLAGLTSGLPAAVMVWPQDSLERAIYLATQHRVIKLFQAGEAAELQLRQHFFDEALSVTALAVAPNNEVNGTIWAATTRGLYRSQDRGVQWALMLDLPQELPVLWLEVTSTHLNVVTLGGCTWRAQL